MPLTAKEITARLDAISDCLTLEADTSRLASDARLANESPDTRMRRAVYLLGKLRGELQTDRGSD